MDETFRKSSTTIVRQVSRSDIDAMVMKHYLHAWPSIVPCCLRLEHNGQAVGMIVFAYPPKQTMKRYGGMTWELARLWVDDCMPRNTESWFIGQAIRHVRKEHAFVEYLVSYADPSVGHRGTIYLATNWREDGRTDDSRKTPRFDYLVAGVRYSRKGRVPQGATYERIPRVSKHRFVYPLHRRGRHVQPSS
jgi:hypothetical protein